LTQGEKPPFSEIELDAFDMDMLVTIVMVGFRYGSTSSYTIWSYMKDEAIRTGDHNKFMAYKNINKRIIRFLNHGLISQINTNSPNVHGRKEYVLTDVGLAKLVPYFLAHPVEVKLLVYYLNYNSIDKKHFGRLLRKGYASAAEALNAYDKYSKSLDPDLTIMELDADVGQSLKLLKRKGESYERLLERLLKQAKANNENQIRKEKETSKIAD
jgi:hypothetical protein